MVLEMVFIPRFVDSYVAFSPMPSDRDVINIAMVFKAVVILVHSYELEYNIDYLKLLGIDVLHIPVDDFSAPSVDVLHDIVKWIIDRVEKGLKVLVHCRGGKGRSGVVVAAYLMYRYCIDPDEAIEIVRNLAGNAIEAEKQIETVYDFWRIYVARMCRSHSTT